MQIINFVVKKCYIFIKLNKKHDILLGFEVQKLILSILRHNTVTAAKKLLLSKKLKYLLCENYIRFRINQIQKKNLPTYRVEEW